MKLVPRLRFNEFKTEWSSSPLGEKTKSIASGRDKPQENGEFLVYGSTGVIGRNQNYSHEGDFILVARVGANAGTINRIVGKFAVTDNTLVIELKHDLLVPFCEAYLRRIGLNKLIFGSGQPLITGGQLKSLLIKYPALPEQTRISSFITAVDERIQHLTRKKELLEQYKKGVMQQIFSQKIRFKDDNGKPYPEWLKRRLSDFSDLIHGDGDWILSENIGMNEKYSIIQLGNIGYGAFIEKQMKTLSEENFIKIKGTPIKKGDLLLNRMVDDNKINVCTLRYSGDFVTSVDVCWIRFGTGLVNVFLMYLLLSKQSQKAMLGLSSGSGRVRISKTNLFERFYFRLPCVQEQQKIASLIASIDAKIEGTNLHIDQIQTFKRGLLQQMFV